MNELEVGDKVWVQVNVFDVVGESVLVCGNADKSWWVHKRDCKPVEPEAVEQTKLKAIFKVKGHDRRGTVGTITKTKGWLSLFESTDGKFLRWCYDSDFDLLDESGKRISQSSEPEAVEKPAKKEPTEAQKIADRTIKAIWETHDQPEPDPAKQTETVGPKTICVGDNVTWRGYKGIVAEWCETTQRFCFLHENGSRVWVGESELSPMEPAKLDSVEATPQKPFQVGDLIEVCNPHLGTHGHRGVVTEVLPGFEGVKININNCWFVLSHKSLRLAKPEPDPVVEQPSTTEPETKRPETTTTHYGPDISKVSFEFTQEPNTLGTTDASGCGSEDLTVECEYQLPGEEPFFVIRSTSGWSFDEPETLLALLNSVKDAEKKCRCSLPQS